MTPLLTARFVRRRSRRCARGFTLVELLTVIAIIGILAAIVIPVVGKMRVSARSVQCLSNLRQAGVASRIYAESNRGAALPTRVDSNFTTHPYCDRNWGPIVYMLMASRNGSSENAPALAAGSDYSQDDRFFYMCPDSPIPVNHRAYGNYVTHPVIMRKVSASADEYKLINVVRPSQVIMIADGAQNADGNCGVSGSPFDKTYPSSASGQGPAALLDQSNPDRDLGNVGWLRYRHNGKVNCLFVDGHVASLVKGSLTYANVLESR